jgi:hypothetical protein
MLSLNLNLSVKLLSANNGNLVVSILLRLAIRVYRKQGLKRALNEFCGLTVG